MKGITSGFDISSAFYTFSLVKRIVLTRIIFILSFFPIFLYSQDKEIKDMGSNMVPNNSFESIKKIPTHWYMNGEDFCCALANGSPQRRHTAGAPWSLARL